MLRWFLVCFICYSKSFDFFYIQTLHNDCSYIEYVPPPFLCKFDKHFLIFRAVELKHFPSEMLRGVLFSVICNLSSFHSFIIKFCITGVIQ